MTATLRPLRDDEYAAWCETARRGYAWSIEHEGGEPHELAIDKADRDFAELLPDGLATPDHAVFALGIDERFRRRGLGRAAMEAAEDEARRRGLSRVELNVFGGNRVVRSLYRALGYEESAVYMGKDVAS